MKRYFNLDAFRNGLYKEIAETIKKYYPQGLSTSSPEYHAYPGIIEAKKIIGANIRPPGEPLGIVAKNWHSLLRSLSRKTDKQINGTTYGFVPGFSADLIFEKFEDESLIRIKRMALAVSMIGPFYSICGIDETFIKERGEYPGSYHAINVITASPYHEFEGDFNGIKYLIEKKFSGYKLVPFNVCMMYLKDFKTLVSIEEEGTVYNALFNHLFNFYTHYKARGDGYYGAEKDPNIKITLSPPPMV